MGFTVFESFFGDFFAVRFFAVFVGRFAVGFDDGSVKIFELFICFSFDFSLI